MSHGTESTVSPATRIWRSAGLSLAVGLVLATPFREAASADGAPSPVTRANCGPQDHVESGLQGQTTLAERFAPGTPRAYSCNLEPVGQFEGEGSGFALRTFQNCAYVSTWQNPGMRHPGVVVLDTADSRHPKPTAYLSTPAMLSANESLAIDSKRGLLLADKFPPTAGALFDIYDLSADCHKPVLIATTSIPHMHSHQGEFSPDGSIFYGASYGVAMGPIVPDPAAPAAAIFAIDMTNPAHPSGIATWIPPDKSWTTHGVSLNKDGTRAFVGLQSYANPAKPDGLVILDISDVQARRPKPQLRLVSNLFWDDGQVGQWALPVTIKGRLYLIWSDGGGSIPLIGARPDSVCNSGKPSHGLARIIDISNEAQPKVVAKLMLEVADPAHCSEVLHDPTMMGYGSGGCAVDDDSNAKLLACAYYESGLRVFDIRDPIHPREVAYYKPPATRMHDHAGSPFSQSAPPLMPMTVSKDHTTDTVATVEFRKSGEIWFSSFDNGFQVVRFSERFKAAHRDLFQD